jgi:hypothetical protein
LVICREASREREEVRVGIGQRDVAQIGPGFECSPACGAGAGADVEQGRRVKIGHCALQAGQTGRSNGIGRGEARDEIGECILLGRDGGRRAFTRTVECRSRLRAGCEVLALNAGQERVECGSQRWRKGWIHEAFLGRGGAARKGEA